MKVKEERMQSELQIVLKDECDQSTWYSYSEMP